MRLTPVDIRQQQFTVRMFRGLDPDEVDAFLEDVAEDYEALLKENAQLKEQVTLHEDRTRGAMETERTLKETLLTTQKLTEEMKENAKREAQLLVREAQLTGEKQLEEARGEEAKIRADIQGLRRLRRQIVEDLRATVDRYQRMLITEAGPGDVDPKK